MRTVLHCSSTGLKIWPHNWVSFICVCAETRQILRNFEYLHMYIFKDPPIYFKFWWATFRRRIPTREYITLWHCGIYPKCSGGLVPLPSRNCWPMLSLFRVRPRHVPTELSNWREELVTIFKLGRNPATNIVTGDLLWNGAVVFVANLLHDIGLAPPNQLCYFLTK